MRVCDAWAVPETSMMHTMVLAVVVIAETCMQPTPAMARLRRGAMGRLRGPFI